MQKGGNFRRRRRSKRPVQVFLRAFRRLRPRLEAAFDGGRVLFFAVVLGVALLFRLGIGWARGTTEAAPTDDATASTARAETKPAAHRGRLRAEAGGVATIAAVASARARALVALAARDREPVAITPTPKTPTLDAPAAPPGLPPSPSFLRARSAYEHRHDDGSLDARPPTLRAAPPHRPFARPKPRR